MPTILLPECTVCTTVHKYYRCSHIITTTNRLCRACKAIGEYGPCSRPMNIISYSNLPCPKCIDVWDQKAPASKVICLMCGATHKVFRCGHIRSNLTVDMTEGGCVMCQSAMREPNQVFKYVRRDCDECAMTICARRRTDMEDRGLGIEANDAEILEGPGLSLGNGVSAQNSLELKNGAAVVGEVQVVEDEEEEDSNFCQGTGF
ncbi:hypothetical protein ACMFMF_002864 [Clarireedia jacksonii]